MDRKHAAPCERNLHLHVGASPKGKSQHPFAGQHAHCTWAVCADLLVGVLQHQQVLQLALLALDDAVQLVILPGQIPHLRTRHHTAA
jgi:hypothetical protein